MGERISPTPSDLVFDGADLREPSGECRRCEAPRLRARVAELEQDWAAALTEAKLAQDERDVLADRVAKLEARLKAEECRTCVEVQERADRIAQESKRLSEALAESERQRAEGCDCATCEPCTCACHNDD